METLEELFSLGADSLAARYVLFVVLLILISCQLYAYIIDMSRYPKGPISLPLIGNVLNLFWHGDMLDFLMSSWRRYGDIFSIKIGSKMFVVLNGYETINEALVKRAEAFSEHNDFHNLSGAGPEKTGILFSPYPVWKKHRKLVLTVFKDMGYVRQGLQEKVNQEIAKVIPEMEFIKKPFVIEEILQRAVSNVISNVVFGCRFEYDDEEFRTLLDINKKLIMRGRTIAIVSLFPLLLHLPFDIFKVKDTLNIAARLEEIMLKKITEHEKASDQVQTSFIDAYLGEISKDEESKTGYFTKQRCVSAICDLFGAGSETTSTALDWAFLHCILFPELQERVHNEIDHVLALIVPTMMSKPKHLEPSSYE